MARPGKARTLVGLVPLFLGGVRLARGVERESDTRVGFPLLDMKSWSVKCRCRTNLTSNARPRRSFSVVRPEVSARWAALSVALTLDADGRDPSSIAWL